MEAVSGRDKPHSQARLATAAIGLGLVAAAVLVATSVPVLDVIGLAGAAYFGDVRIVVDTWRSP